MRKRAIIFALTLFMASGAFAFGAVGGGAPPPPGAGPPVNPISESEDGNEIGKLVGIILLPILAKHFYDDFQANGCHPCRGGLGMFTGDEDQIEIEWTNK